MLLYLIRHAESQANVRHVVTGTPEDTLSDLGERQAREAGGLPAVGAFQQCWVSHWERARQTAALAYPEKEFLIEKRLGEVNGGMVADLPLEIFYRDYPDFYGKFDPDRAFPGGESHAELYARVVDWLQETAERYGDSTPVLAVTHTGPISCLLQYALRIPMDEYPKFRPRNCALSILRVPEDAAPSRCELLGYNICRHSL